MDTNFCCGYYSVILLCLSHSFISPEAFDIYAFACQSDFPHELFISSLVEHREL